MKPFKFSLQALLVLREQEENKALQSYAKALMVRERALSALRAAEEELTKAWGTINEKLGATIHSLELTHMQNYCQSVEWRIKECEVTAKQAREETERAFLELLAARQARSVLEKFRERELNRYVREKRKKEQRQLDDLPSSRPGLMALFRAPEAVAWN